VQVTDFVDKEQLGELLERVLVHSQEVEECNSTPAFWLLGKFL
jgi:hypothetical protein